MNPTPLPPGSSSPPQAAPRSVPIRLPQARPYVTYAIIAVTILFFLLQAASSLLLGDDLVILYLAKINELIVAGQFWRLFTPMLAHAGIFHVGVNMYSLFVLGPTLERFYGHGRFLLLYLLGGFAGNVLSFLFSDAASVGASTAIFGLLGAQGVFLYHNRKLFGDIARRGINEIVQVIVINLLIGFSPSLRLDLWGHFGGLIGGALFALLAGPRLTVEGVFPELRAADQREPADSLRAALVVGALFVLLAGGAIYLRGGFP